MGVYNMGVEAGLFRIKGRLSLEVVRPDGTIRDSRRGDNIMCSAGLTALAGAIVWSGLQDQAGNLGITSPTYLTPLWGAVGSGTGTVAAADTLLFSELGRQSVGAGASGPATPTLPAEFTWLFYFPSPATTWTVTEAGVFANGSSDDSTVALAGTMLDHWAFSPSLSVPTTDTLILQATFTLAGA
jgi:hypothetical protein